MLSAHDERKEPRVAIDVAKSDGPFFCPECREPVFVKKGDIKIHHFSHHADSNCMWGTGESEEHLAMKLEAYKMLRASPYCWRVGVEFRLDLPNGRYRVADVYYETLEGDRRAIEIQLSQIPIDDIVQRTRDYNSINVYPMWVVENTDFDDRWCAQIATLHGGILWSMVQSIGLRAFSSQGRTGGFNVDEAVELVSDRGITLVPLLVVKNTIRKLQEKADARNRRLRRKAEDAKMRRERILPLLTVFPEAAIYERAPNTYGGAVLGCIVNNSYTGPSNQYGTYPVLFEAVGGCLVGGLKSAYLVGLNKSSHYQRKPSYMFDIDLKSTWATSNHLMVNYILEGDVNHLRFKGLPELQEITKGNLARKESVVNQSTN